MDRSRQQMHFVARQAVPFRMIQRRVGFRHIKLRGMPFEVAGQTWRSHQNRCTVNVLAALANLWMASHKRL